MVTAPVIAIAIVRNSVREILPSSEAVYAACGFSGHGFMQSPAVGRALAQEILEGGSSFDLEPYRLDRFGDELEFPETLVL